MRPPNLPAGGTCRCSATRIEISESPLLTVACHCVDCQKMSASAFSLTAMIPAEGFKIMAGRPVARPLPGSLRKHYFCPRCMTWMYSRVEGVRSRVNLRPTLLDDPSWFKPFVETMTKDKLPWAVTAAIHTYQAFPLPDEFEDLLVKYADWAKPG
ncbi:MAG: GFA family protein [Pseudomonadota bacterium]